MLKYSIYSALAAVGSASPWLSGCAKYGNTKGPNVILITLDTTRVDHLSCYGYPKTTSPNLDRLAEESVLYTRAISPASWTLPAHASLFTGKFTTSHGARYDAKGPLCLVDSIENPPDAWKIPRARGLSQNEPTLASILNKEGYSTGAVVAGPWLKKVFGLDKGFEYYDDREISSINGRLAKQVTNSALEWVSNIRDSDFFLFLNYFDPHIPYTPPEDFFCSFLPISNAKQLLKGRKPTIPELIALYDGEILYMDYYIGKLLQKLKEAKLYDKTMIIVTADHGELFGEHGKFEHGYFLYQEEIHIPLLIKYPGAEVLPCRSDAHIQLNDIISIILERLSIERPNNIQSGIPPQIGHPLLAETYPLSVLGPNGHWCAIFENEFKFIWNSKGKHQLINLSNDPGEEVNLIDEQPQIAAHMQLKMDQYLDGLPKPKAVSAQHKVDEETQKALKSLGYIE